MRRKSILFIGLVLLTCIVLSPRDVAAQTSSFPEGLELHYIQTLKTNGVVTSEKLFIYKVIGWEIGAGPNVIKINKSIDNYQNDTLYIKIPSWIIVDENGSYTGSYMTTPLWVVLDGWTDEGSIDLPEGSDYSSTYETTSGIDVETPCNNYTCWKAFYDKYQSGWTIWKTVYYERTLGVMTKEVGKMTYSSGVTIIKDTIYELNYTNIQRFQSSPLGISLEVGLVSAGILSIIVVGVIILKRR